TGDYNRMGNIGMRSDRVLHLGGGDGHRASPDHVLLPAGDMKIAVVSKPAEIAGLEEPCLIQHVHIEAIGMEIADKQERAGDEDAPRFAVRQGPALDIPDLDGDAGLLRTGAVEYPLEISMCVGGSHVAELG